MRRVRVAAKLYAAGGRGPRVALIVAIAARPLLRSSLRRLGGKSPADTDKDVMTVTSGQGILEPLRVLLVDDSEDDVALMLRALRDDRRPLVSRTVEDAATMRGALEAQPWDVILCDSSMPQFGARAALDLLREMALATPLIVVSGNTDEKARAAAVNYGARNVVAKTDLALLRSIVDDVCKRETPLTLADERATLVDALPPEMPEEVAPLATSLLGTGADASMRGQLEEVMRAVAWATNLCHKLLASTEGARLRPSARPSGAARSSSLAPLGPAMVLVVDDDDALRAETCGTLRDLGYQILEAKNAGEVLLLGRARLARVDLLLTDVLLPRFNALELFEALRASGLSPKVLFTASDTENAIVHYGVVSAGFPFLAKPWTADVLARALREALGSRPT
jgi:CheY-like chemotaxis protein